MAKRFVKVELTVSESRPSSYSTDTLGTTTLNIPIDNIKQIGKIVQAHADAIMTTVESTYGKVPEGDAVASESSVG